MKVGITTAFSHPDSDIVAFGRAVEERGFSSIYLPHHTHLPVEEGAPPALVGGVNIDDYRSIVDPLIALSAMAAQTTALRLGTGVLLVAQLDPIVLAKELATLDIISNGRVTLGVGYGWNRREAESHGVDFSKRRTIANEKIACMREIWANEPAGYVGKYVEMPQSWSRPKPIQRPSIPVLFGGFPSEKLFSTIAGMADGWIPIGGTGLGANIPLLKREVEKANRRWSEIQIVAFGIFPEEPKLEYFRSIGVTEVVLRVSSGSHNDMLRELDNYSVYASTA